jgi:hypothetical protein
MAAEAGEIVSASREDAAGEAAGAGEVDRRERRSRSSQGRLICPTEALSPCLRASG